MKNWILRYIFFKKREAQRDRDNEKENEKEES